MNYHSCSERQLEAGGGGGGGGAADALQKEEYARSVYTRYKLSLASTCLLEVERSGAVEAVWMNDKRHLRGKAKCAGAGAGTAAAAAAAEAFACLAAALRPHSTPRRGRLGAAGAPPPPPLGLSAPAAHPPRGARRPRHPPA